MKIAGLVKSSLIDYPGKVAAVVFTQGCNFKCGFCHNPELVPPGATGIIDDDYFFNFLKVRAGKLDGVVITGGEPTIQSDLYEVISKIKALGYSVKLDSNGTNPDILEKLLGDKLLDYVAMDIKGPLENYEKICGNTNIKAVARSIKLIMNSGIDYEFRTTVLPYYHSFDDFHKIGELIKGAKAYNIQGFRSGVVLDPTLTNERHFTHVELEKIKDIMSKYVDNVGIRENL
jgi:pyruvate formate lyase activating enzyme